jgi:hypothetical protein
MEAKSPHFAIDRAIGLSAHEVLSINLVVISPMRLGLDWISIYPYLAAHYDNLNLFRGSSTKGVSQTAAMPPAIEALSTFEPCVRRKISSRS